MTAEEILRSHAWRAAKYRREGPPKGSRVQLRVVGPRVQQKGSGWPTEQLRLSERRVHVMVGLNSFGH